MRRLSRALLGGRGPRVDQAGHERLVARLRAERDHYSRVLAAATGDAIFTTGADGVITFFNGGAERLLGYSAEEVVGRMRGLDLHLPEEIETAARELGVEPGRAVFMALAGRGAELREWTFVRSDGSHVRVAHT
jgi:PAS domain S-box-containing protein